MATPMYPVNSSQISYIGYEEDTKELFITFKNGSTYKYENVPEMTYKILLSSPSKGKYFADNIKNIYVSTKIK